MTSEEILATQSHRPFPPPNSPWIFRQEWHNLLFAHWALQAEHVRAIVPQQLQLDTWEGKAYVGVVPFLLRNMSPRGVPPMPVISHFAEINVRTYVTYKGFRAFIFSAWTRRIFRPCSVRGLLMHFLTTMPNSEFG